MAQQITTDSEFKAALSQLNLTQQRQVGALFVERVLNLCDDYRVKNALEAAKQTTLNPEELTTAYRAAKAASTERFTQCGKDADWLAQAGHFVAAASADCVLPTEQLKPTDNLAWNAAMHARMARNCETIAQGEGSDNQEAQSQYEILANFLS